MIKRFCTVATLLVCGFGATAVAHAQETPAAPSPSADPTLMDNAFDGRTHIRVAPYVWAPTVSTNFQYTIPKLPRRPGGTKFGSAQIGPSDYLPNLNSALMFAFDARKGNLDFFGDYMYVNATVSASASAILSGPFGKLQIPISVSTTARLRQSIWEAAAGFTVARDRNANLDFFGGFRDYPLAVTLGYNAVVGRRSRFSRSGSIQTGGVAQDVIFGVRGQAFFGNSHFFVPYYGDGGTAVGTLSNQTWQGYSGAGYAFNHGQTLVVLYRDLTYRSFAPSSPVQKLSMYGPLLGYTFYL